MSTPKSRIVSARFDPAKWSLELKMESGERDSVNLLNFYGLGMDRKALRRLRICECGSGVMFVDIGAMYFREDLETD